MKDVVKEMKDDVKEVKDDVKEVLTNQQKLANLICKVANDKFPRLALLLPPTSSASNEEQSFTDKVQQLYEDAVNAVESALYDKAELMFVCEGPTIDLCSKPGQECSEPNKLELKQSKEWVKALAPVIQFAGVMLNVSAKLMTGITLLDSVGISSDDASAITSFYDANLSEHIANYETFSEPFMTEQEELTEEELTEMQDGYRQALEDNNYKKAAQLTGEAFRQVEALCTARGFKPALTQVSVDMGMCWLCDKCAARHNGSTPGQPAPMEGAAAEAGMVQGADATNKPATDPPREAAVEEEPPSSSCCRVM